METGSPPAFGRGRVPLDPWKNAPPARFSPSVPVARPAPHLLPVGVPGENFCVLRRSQVMDDMEARLRLAAVAYVGGARPSVSCVEAAEAIAAQLNIPRNAFSVHRFHPEDFLIDFATPEFRNSATGAGSVVHQGFELFFRPWIRQAQATARVLRVLVDIMIEGIPSHAWEWETADKILGSSCDIISLAPESASREDLSLFKLRAWCRDANLVPVEKRLWIPEPVEEAGLPAAHQRASCRLLSTHPGAHWAHERFYAAGELAPADELRWQWTEWSAGRLRRLICRRRAAGPSTSRRLRDSSPVGGSTPPAERRSYVLSFGGQSGTV
ncbi:hypothetical protein ZWY2020_042659 [Hordeum vulgare]|nr:hypothetical protein ZWY2020_042659 [Hordeum vulgare]